MKLNRLDVHDKLLHFQNQSETINKGLKECILSAPEEFDSIPFYIFAHPRTIEMDERISLWNQDAREVLMNPSLTRIFKTFEQVPSMRYIWQPRLTKPYPQENSMLFKRIPGTFDVDVIWIIPRRELWDQFKQGNMTESSIIVESIYKFKNNIESLAREDKNDLSYHEANKIYAQIGKNKKYNAKPFEFV
ncbi:MAG: hypothetical protein KGI50_05340 [Patescibacteria group bacterium]|nr:hypothetical protein [Patescibacteria group bacterium]MDE2438770.1 hypothetical protein [Patescibacteria group bacterium]